MLNILIITSHYPSKDQPTKAIYNKYTFAALAKYCNLYLIDPSPWWSHVKDVKFILRGKRENTFGIPVEKRPFYSLPRFRVLHAKAIYRSLKSTITKLNKKNKFDAILSTWVYPDATAAAKIAKDLNIPIIITALGSDINELTKFSSLRKQIYAALSSAHKVVTVSGDMKDKIVQMGIPSSQIIVQHNSVDGKIFKIREKTEVKSQFNLNSEHQHILYVGNLNSEKGVHVLLDAFLYLYKELNIKNIRLIIIGNGPELQKMEQFVSKNNLDGLIYFKGRLLAEDVSKYMNACDVLCLPSFREGCPNVVLESLASGLPVVASNVGGVPELISTNNGYLSEAGNEKELAEYIKKALDHDWNQNDLRRTVKTLSWDSIGENYYNWIMDSIKLKTN